MRNYAVIRREAIAEMNRLRCEFAPEIHWRGLCLLRAVIDLDDSDENRAVKDAARPLLEAMIKLRDLLEKTAILE